MEKQTGSFKAKDPNGKEVTIYEFTQFKWVEDRGGGDWNPISRMLRTESGERVNPQDDGTYETAGWPAVDLTSDDPKAVRLT